ncbi:hypothetical protein JW905_10310 [bacterium]|nr:hypothetical protein [candidate division CSSED10-310 bacterium]
MRYSCIGVVLFLSVMLVIGAEATASTDGATATTVEVHGHWNIKVVNPDGTMASSNEFNNSFNGAPILISLLTNRFYTEGSCGGWMIELDSMDGAKPCNTNPCVLANCSTTCGDPNLVINSTSLNISYVNPTTFRLYGSLTPDTSTNVDKVSTLFKVCESTIVPSNCPNENSACAWQSFTSTVFTPISVSPGQSVDITVDISFCTSACP